MLVTYERFNAAPLPLYDPSEPLDSWPVRSLLFDVASGGAYRANGLQRSTQGQKTIRRRGTFLESTLAELQDALALLEVEVGNTGRLWGRTGSGEVVWTPAELTAVRAVSEPRSTFRYQSYVALDVETELVLPSTAWYAETPIDFVAEDLYDEGESDLPTLGAEGTGVGGMVEWLVINEGNINSTRIVVTITSGTGTISAVELANNTTGHIIRWTGKLTTGQVLRLDAGAGKVHQQTADAYSFAVTTLAASYVLADSSFQVGSTAGMSIGGGVAITLDNGFVFLATIATIPDSTHFTISGAGLPGPAASGNAVSVGLVEPPDKERWFELAPGDNEVTVNFTDSATDDSTRIAMYAEHTSA